MSFSASKPVSDGVQRLLDRLVSADDLAARANDATLLQRLRASDEHACEALVRDHAARLLAGARRLLQSEEEACEVVRQAFAAAFLSLPRFTGESSLGRWLTGHVLDAALRRLRSEVLQAADGIEVLLPRFDSRGAHAELIEAWEAPRGSQALAPGVLRRVLDAMTRLPARHRAALVLRDVEGLDAAETAAILERRPDEVERLLREARQALRALLATVFARGSRREDH